MSSKYKAYAEYKDSGVEWLGEIPVDWSVFSGKRIFKNTRKPATSTDQQLAASQKYGVIPQTLMMELNDAKVMLALKGTDSFKHVDKNNFVISLRSFEGGIEHSLYSGCVSPAYTVLLASKTIHYKYFKYLLKCSPFVSALQASTDSLRDGKSITYEQFGAIPLACPELNEQCQIANFLDHETAKIDNLIEEQKTLIRLLQEKRQAVISHAVTKGLNPDAPMKDSGVEWFDQSPEHWKIGKLGYYAKITNGATPSRENMSYWTDGSIGWLNSSKVNDVYITEANQFITPLAVSKTSVQKVEPDDLVMAITGEGQTRGRVAICTIEATINQHLAAISLTSSEISYKYLFHYLVSQYERIRYESAGAGSTKGAITCGDIASFPVPVPSNKGQDEIVLYIEQKVSKFDILINLASEQVRLATERRTALISAAVTGKIDVRDWTPPAPQKEQQQEMALCN